MKKLSGIVIAKNEQEVIADCLDSIAFCDERIVIDTGSEDSTEEIAKRLGAIVHTHICNDFSEMRNEGLKKATAEWILYVDADERVSEGLGEEIESTIANAPFEVGAYKVPRKNYYLGKYEWPKIEKLERLFRRRNLVGWYGKIHESPDFTGQVKELKHFLVHNAHRDLESMLNKTIEWSKIEAQLRFEAGHPHITWWRFPRVMISTFWSSYVLQGGWKVGTVGIIESMYQAFSTFITYARLWETQSKFQPKADPPLGKNEK